MGKIKGWTKYLELPGRIRYTTNERNKKGHKVVIGIDKYYHAHKKGSFWTVDVNELGDKTLLSKKFDTKTDSMNFAVSYMRKHPGGN